MWCRILSVVAITCTFTLQVFVQAQMQDSPRIDQIKDVLCMMLLNGLQKKDLDVNTLEKLTRHNVNIADMNNEQLRQQCFNTTEKTTKVKDLVARDGVMEISTNKSDDTDGNTSEYNITLEMRIPNTTDNIMYITLNQSKSNENESFLSELKKITESFQTTDEMDKTTDLGTATHVEDGTVTNIEVSKDLQIGFIQNQPSLQNVLNFWTKLTHNTKKTITKSSTTIPPWTPEVTSSIKAETLHNTGYVHSREMEYIGRIIAEYLASQSVPTSTKKVATKTIPITSTSANNIESTDKPSLHELMKNVDDSLALAKIVNNITVTEKAPHESINESHEQIDNTHPHINPRIHHNDVFEEASTTTRKPDNDSNQSVDSNEVVQFNDGLEIVDTPYVDDFNRRSTKTSEPNINDPAHPLGLTKNALEINREVAHHNTPLNTDSTTESLQIPITEKSDVVDNSQLLNRYKNKTHNLNEEPYDIMKLENVNAFDTDINNVTTSIPQNFNDKKLTTTNWIQQTTKVIPKNNNLVKPKAQQNSAKNKIAPKGVNKFVPVQNKGKNVTPANKKNPTPAPFKATPPSMKNKNSKVENKPVISAALSKQIKKADPFRGMMPSIKNKNSKLGTKPPTTPSISKKIEKANPFKNLKPKAAVNKNARSTVVPKQNWSPVHYSGLPKTKPKKDGRINKTKPSESSQESVELNLNDSIKSQTINISQIPALIKNIAEEVKQIVLEDIRKETIFAINSTSAITTVSPKISTTITTEKPQQIPTQMQQANQVMHKLKEMFDQFELLKENMRSTVRTPLTSSHHQQLSAPAYKSPLAPSHPFMTKPQPIVVNPVDISPYGPKMVPIPISSGANLPKLQFTQYVPPLQPQPYNQNQQQYPPIIQTNSEEIPPLAIQVSNPSRLMNHHIIITTKNPVEQLREYHEREKEKILRDGYRGIDKVKIYKEQYKVQADLAKNGLSDDSPTSDKYVSARTNNNRVKPKYRLEYLEKIRDLHHLDNSSHPGSLSFSRGLSFSEGLPNSGLKGSLSDSNGGLSNTEKLSYTGAMSRTRGLGHPGVLSDFRRPTSSDSDPERIGRYPYSRLLARQRQPGLYGRMYLNSDRDRPRTRYEATKFHEKLERIEGWPRSRWREYADRGREYADRGREIGDREREIGDRGREYGDRAKDIESEGQCCNDIPPRQQQPISKVKKHRKYDDTKFKNFLKSQQKVTDMLEKILEKNMKANNTDQNESNSAQVILP